MNPNQPAFPNRNAFKDQIGLTKREYFAALALQALLFHTGINMQNYKLHAQHATAAADSLIAQLKVTKEDEDDTQGADSL